MRRSDLTPLVTQLNSLESKPGVHLRYGVIAGINENGTVDLYLNGDTEVLLEEINVANTAGMWSVGDVVAVLKGSHDLLVLDRVQDTRGPAARWSLPSGNSPSLTSNLPQLLLLTGASSAINYEYPSEWSTGLSGYTHVIPQEGVYRIDAQVGFHTSGVATSHYVQTEIYKNPTSQAAPEPGASPGGTLIGFGRTARNGPSPASVYATYTGALAAGDEIGVAGRQVNLGFGLGVAETATLTYLQISWVRPINESV